MSSSRYLLVASVAALSLAGLAPVASLVPFGSPLAPREAQAKSSRTDGESTDAKPRAKSRADRPEMVRSKKPIAGGTHWRISTDNGPIHVWVPPGYDRGDAGLVIYIHGYHVTADKAWKHHKLAEQFRKSRQNAMFLVIEAPSSNDDRVYWKSLVELKKTVRRAGMRLPDGPSVAIAHSGGFRTVSGWVDNKLLAQVILLDAMYGGEKAFDEFIHSGKRAQHHKMVIVASDTASQSKKFAKKFRYAAVKSRIPESFSEFTKRELRTKLLYIRSQFGHGTIVDGGVVLPLILRLTPLRRM